MDDTQVQCGECENVIAEGAKFFAVKVNNTMQALCEICSEHIPRARVLFKDFTPRTRANPQIIKFGLAVLCEAAEDGFKPTKDEPDFGINVIYVKEKFPRLLNGAEV